MTIVYIIDFRITHRRKESKKRKQHSFKVAPAKKWSYFWIPLEIQPINNGSWVYHYMREMWD